MVGLFSWYIKIKLDTFKRGLLMSKHAREYQRRGKAMFSDENLAIAFKVLGPLVIFMGAIFTILTVLPAMTSLLTGGK